MKNYELTVIIPTFNLEDSIEKALNSIKNQTLGFENIEVIFVDDCSTDTTPNILTKVENQYENVKVFSTGTNSGYAGRPRNIGIENSTSDYLLFLDGDDELLVDACEYLLKQAKSSKSDITIGGQINVFKNGVLQHNPPLFAGLNQNITNTINSSILSIRPAITAKLFKKDLILKNSIKFREDIPGQDFVFLEEALIKSEKISTLNNFYVYYRNLNDNSVTFNLTDKYFQGLMKAYIYACDIFEENDVPFKIQEVVLHNHLSFFTNQVIKASKNKEMKHNFETELFSELSGKKIFQNNKNFTKYFDEMKNGNFENDYLDRAFKELEIEHDNINLKNLLNEIKNIKLTQNKIINENEYLKKANSNLYTKSTNLINEYEKLYEENTNLKNKITDLETELAEIKSTRLWKLKNKF